MTLFPDDVSVVDVLEIVDRWLETHPAATERAELAARVCALCQRGVDSVAEQLVVEWNQTGLTSVRKMSDKRRRVLQARLRDPDWSEHWRQALERAAQSAFCTGKNDRGWIADIDWFLRPDTVTRLLEGRYDTLGGHHARGDAARIRNGARTATRTDTIPETHAGPL